MDASLDETRRKMLGELAELALVLARDLQQAALTAETTDEKVRLADAFHRLGRGVRQSLALHAKLDRDAARSLSEASAQPASDPKERRAARAATLQRDVERLIWTERERLDSDPAMVRIRLERLLAIEAKAEDFLETEPEVQIEHLCAMLGVRIPSDRRHRPKPRDDGDGVFCASG